MSNNYDDNDDKDNSDFNNYNNDNNGYYNSYRGDNKSVNFENSLRRCVLLLTTGRSVR